MQSTFVLLLFVVWSLSHVPLFWDPMDFSSPGSNVHGIFQARKLEWVAISFSRWSSRPRDRTQVSCTGRRILYYWATTLPVINIKTLKFDINSLYSIFQTKSSKSSVYLTKKKSSFRLATFQVFRSHMWIIASVLSSKTMPKPLTVWITINCGKFWKIW